MARCGRSATSRSSTGHRQSAVRRSANRMHGQSVRFLLSCARLGLSRRVCFLSATGVGRSALDIEQMFMYNGGTTCSVRKESQW